MSFHFKTCKTLSNGLLWTIHIINDSNQNYDNKLPLKVFNLEENQKYGNAFNNIEILQLKQ